MTTATELGSKGGDGPTQFVYIWYNFGNIRERAVDAVMMLQREVEE
jgi:hypothetical protein